MKREKAMRGGISAASAALLQGEVQTAALAGSSSTDATKITGEFVLFNSGTGGAILPASNRGDAYEIKNESGSTCTLYPPSGATINGASSLSVATAKSCRVWFSSPTACHSNPTVPS